MITNKFIEIFPNYKSFTSDKYIYNSMSHELLDGITGILYRHIDEEHYYLSKIVNILLTSIPKAPTQNSGIQLQTDFSNALYNIEKNNFPGLMDALIKINLIFSQTLTNDLNEILKNTNFGFYIVRDFKSITWELNDPDIERTENILLVIKPNIQDQCKQSYQHIEQVLRNLSGNTLRSNKDALRDALSAMESFLLKKTDKTEIRTAFKDIKSNGKNIGESVILKDGEKIWDILHMNYPDLRHGNPEISDIDIIIVKYWIERILSYINYLLKK